MSPSRQTEAVGGQRHHRVSVWVGVLGMLAAVLMPVQPHTAVAQADRGLELIGELDGGGVEVIHEGNLVLGINHETRRLYTALGTAREKRIGEYDLDADTDVPPLLRISEPILPFIVAANPSAVVFDPGNDRILMLGAPPAASTGNSGDRVVYDIDLATLTVNDIWAVRDTVPGFFAMALAYSPERDRVYMMGTMDVDASVRSATRIVTTDNPVTAIVALDGQSGAREWIHLETVGTCDTPLYDGMAGSTLGLSELRSRLYVFCTAGRTAGSPTGQSGLLRVDIRDEADASGIVEFPTEFFPVSGDYADGVAIFDPARERFFVHSLSDLTHGAWVFDGLVDSWVGLVSSVDNTNRFVGLDPVTGKHYMAGGSSVTSNTTHGYINITDGSATPVPQGRVFRHLTASGANDEGKLVPLSNMAIDPATGRVFLGAGTQTEERTPNSHVVSRLFWAVLRDTTPPITPLAPLDFDRLTHDLADEDAHLDFRASTSGFGAQYVVVGGWEGVYSRVGTPGFDLMPSVELVNVAQLQYGNRGSTMSQVREVEISTGASSASAIPTQPDNHTVGDAETKSRPVDDAVDEVEDLLGPEEDDSTEEADEVEWFSAVTCLDGHGERLDNEVGSEGEPAHAIVTCDLKNKKTTAHSRFEGGSGGGGVFVGASSFDARSHFEPGRGVVTEAEAVAEGIVFGDPALGVVTIDRVTTTSTTVANGRPGTASVRWERVVERAQTHDPEGNASQPRSCTTIVESGKDVVEEGDCSSLQDDLNAMFPQRFEVKFPLPEVVGTPAGAFASLQQTERDWTNAITTYNQSRQWRAVPGMEVTVFNDGAERGRLWVQLASIRSDARFVRTPVLSWPGGNVEPGQGGNTSTGGVDAGLPPQQAMPVPLLEPPAPQVDESTGIQLISHDERLVGAFGWLPNLRSVRDALLAGVLYLLFLLPFAEVIRRRRLLSVFADGSSHTA